MQRHYKNIFNKEAMILTPVNIFILNGGDKNID